MIIHYEIYAGVRTSISVVYMQKNIILVLRWDAIFILLRLHNDYLYKEYFFDNIILKHLLFT